VLLSYLRTVAAVETVEPNWIVHADAIPADPKFAKLWAFRNTAQVVNNGSVLATAVAGKGSSAYAPHNAHASAQGVRQDGTVGTAVAGAHGQNTVSNFATIEIAALMRIMQG